MRKTLIFLALLALVFSAKVVQDSAADALVDELNDMERGVRQEQSEHTALFQAQYQECATEINFRTQEIADANDAYARSQVHLGACQVSQAASQADLEKAQQYVVNINDILNTLASLRLAERQAFQALLNDELNPAIAAVRGAYDILDEYEANGVGFLQISKHMSKVFKHAVTTKKTDKFAPIAMALVQLQTADLSDQAHAFVEQVRKLFQDLEDDLIQAVQVASDTETNRAAVYASTVEQYNAILANLADLESKLNDYLGELADCISEESTISAEATAKVNHNGEALQHAVDLCSALQVQYDNATADRNTELALLDKVEQFVNDQAAIFGDYGNDGADPFEDFKAQYEAQRQAQQQNFLQMKFKKPVQKAKCVHCKRFVQMKLGY